MSVRDTKWGDSEVFLFLISLISIIFKKQSNNSNMASKLVHAPGAYDLQPHTEGSLCRSWSFFVHFLLNNRSTMSNLVPNLGDTMLSKLRVLSPSYSTRQSIYMIPVLPAYLQYVRCCSTYECLCEHVNDLYSFAVFLRNANSLYTRRFYWR